MSRHHALLAAAALVTAALLVLSARQPPAHADTGWTLDPLEVWVPTNASLAAVLPDADCGAELDTATGEATPYACEDPTAIPRLERGISIPSLDLAARDTGR
ncbi:MAG: hypothetical protein H6733_04635 [Alphaproteobacteria bacterium]|nr:hypothetical protein [Alphaproteobacteria bacterium]